MLKNMFIEEIINNCDKGLFEKVMISILQTDNGERFINEYSDMIHEKGTKEWMIYLKFSLQFPNVDYAPFEFIELLTLMYILDMDAERSIVNTFRYLKFAQRIGISNLSDKEFEEAYDKYSESFKRNVENFDNEDLISKSIYEYIDKYREQTYLPLYIFNTIFLKEIK